MSAEQATLFKLNYDAVGDTIVEQIDTPLVEPSTHEVELAIAIMQQHLEKEARNREVAMLMPEDLCPMQKRDLTRDLAKLFRG